MIYSIASLKFRLTPFKLSAIVYFPMENAYKAFKTQREQEREKEYFTLLIIVELNFRQMFTGVQMEIRSYFYAAMPCTVGLEMMFEHFQAFE